MRLTFVIAFSLATIFCNAQPPAYEPGVFRVELTDAFGAPIKTSKNTDVEGSVFLFDDYRVGRIKVKNKIYGNVNVKLDLEKNLVYFEKDGVEMVTAENVSMLEIMNPFNVKSPHVFKNGFPATGKNNEKTYYQVLDSGKVTLLKNYNIIFRESKPYGATTTTKSYEQVKVIYLLSNGVMIPVKKTDQLLEALADKRDLVQSFISSNKTKANKEDDLKAVISYYNKL